MYDFTLIKNYLLFTDEQAVMTQLYCNTTFLLSKIPAGLFTKSISTKKHPKKLRNFTHNLSGTDHRAYYCPIVIKF